MCRLNPNALYGVRLLFEHMARVLWRAWVLYHLGFIRADDEVASVRLRVLLLAHRALGIGIGGVLLFNAPRGRHSEVTRCCSEEVMG